MSPTRLTAAHCSICSSAAACRSLFQPAELAGAIARTRGDSALAEEMAKAILVLPGVQWIALDDALARRSAELAARYRLRGADAVYSAVALTHGCDLVSLDHEHLTRLATVVPTLTPTDALTRLRAAGAQ